MHSKHKEGNHKDQSRKQWNGIQKIRKSMEQKLTLCEDH